MSFKENLLKKIKIDEMSKTVTDSVGTPDSGKKIDKQTLRGLFEMGQFTLRKERDLELYLFDSGADKGKIAVLDNELAIYNTTPEDVGMRKSPTVKEMLNVRNIIKILNDSDVVVSKREESVRTIQKACNDLLDLSFDASDIEMIEKDGAASLEREFTDGVLECLRLFAELLGYVPAPKAFKLSHHEIIGKLIQKENNEMLFGPMVIYNIIHNRLMLIEEQISSLNKQKIEFVHNVASGKEKSPVEGAEVLAYLRNAVTQK